jgi:large subunit ribosomal protein L17
MRHLVAGRQLSRTTSHRRALRRNQAIALFQHGAIRTTTAKAKELKSFVEKLITMAKKGTLHARRMVSSELGNRRGQRGVLYDDEEKPLEVGLLDKLFGEIAPRYAARPGGYTRIIHLAERRLGDAGEQVILQLVEETKASGGEAAVSGASRRSRRAAKRHKAVQEAAAAPAETTSAETEPAEAEPEAPAGEEEDKA